ncbi:hypothetical protein TNCV_1547941, partial [Trichonephila clavipes]
VFKITTRSRLEALLHRIPDVLEDSFRQSCCSWRLTEGFVNTDPAGVLHLRSVPIGIRNRIQTMKWLTSW